MKAIAIPLVGLFASLLAGCETPLPPGAEPGPNGTMAYSVLVEASEPEARIEANGEHMGETPVQMKIFGDRDGTFHDFGSSTFVIRALPVSTNQFPQTRVFQTGQMLGPQDKIPGRIYFDMTQPEPVYVPVPVYVAPPPSIYFGTSFSYGPSYYHHRHGYHHPHAGLYQDRRYSPPHLAPPVPSPPHPHRHH